MASQNAAASLSQPPVQADGVQNTRDFLDFSDAYGNLIGFVDSNGVPTYYATGYKLLGLTPPTGTAVTPQGTAGGTTYGYRVSSVNAAGTETPAATGVTTTTGNATLSASNSVLVSWNPVNGASQYKVYGRTSGSELLMATVNGDGRSGSYTFLDTGAISPVGALPGNPAGGKMILQAWQSQTGNILEIQKSDGTVLTKIDQNGVVNAAGYGGTQSATAVVITNGNTIATANVAVARVAPGGAVTGIILAAGTVPGQEIVVLNESIAGSTVTMAASGTSNVADGVASVIAGLTSRCFTWDSVTALWYPNK